MIRVGVIGATGYAGAELVRILAGPHPTSIVVENFDRHALIPEEYLHLTPFGTVPEFPLERRRFFLSRRTF